MPVKADMTQSNSLHEWWSTYKRKEPYSVPAPADAFIAGFAAARAIYLPHAEKAIDELSRIRHPDTTGQ